MDGTGMVGVGGAGGWIHRGSLGTLSFFMEVQNSV